MEHPAATALRVQADAAARATDTARKGAQLALSGSIADMGTMAEATALGLAAFRRGMAMQKTWIDGWQAWARYAQTVEASDTVPKFVERSGNVALQAEAQLIAQARDVSELMDNVAVSYGWWLTRTLERRRG